MKTTFLYIWSDGIRYYGGKGNNPNVRLVQHIREAFYKNGNSYHSKKNKYIRMTYHSRAQAEEAIRVIYLDEVPVDEWENLEITLIRDLRDRYGEDVLNTGDGGEGSKGSTGTITIPQEVVDYVRDTYHTKTVTELANQFLSNTGWISKLIYNEVRYDPDYNPPEKSLHGKLKTTAIQVQWMRLISSEKDYQYIADCVYYEFGVDLNEFTVRSIILNKTKVWYDPNWDPTNRVYTGEPWS